MTTSRIHHCLQPGVSVLVGTVDACGAPSCCRAVAFALTDDLEAMTVYIPVATSHQAIQNIGTTKRLAVNVSHPIDHHSVQFKGTTSDARLARDDEAPLIRARIEAFADTLEAVGVPRRVARSVAHWPAFAVTMRVEQVFEQTPGPHAGTRLR